MDEDGVNRGRRRGAQVQDGLSSGEILLGRAADFACLQAVRSINVFLFWGQRQGRARAREAHGETLARGQDNRAGYCSVQMIWGCWWLLLQRR